MNNNKKPTSFAIFGAGRIGKIHFHDVFMNERSTVEWVVDANIEFATHLVKKYGAEERIKVCSIEDADQVYRDEKVDAIMICTPTPTHKEIILKALNSGKAVFTEKPLASSLEDVAKCYDLAKQQQMPLFCALNRRFDPQIRQIYDKIVSQELGKVRMIKTCSCDPIGMASKEYLMTSDGVHMDTIIHDIDMVCWLAGERPTSVFASSSTFNEMYKEAKDFDTNAVILTFPSGIIGLIQTVREITYGYDQRIEVILEKGMLETENMRLKQPLINTTTGKKLPTIELSFTSRYIDSYAVELDYFIDVLEGKVENEITAESTILATHLAEVCKISATKGQAMNITKQNIGKM